MNRTRRLLLSFAATSCLAALLAPPARAAFDFSVTPRFNSSGVMDYTLAWTATTDPSSSTLKTTYLIAWVFGNRNPLNYPLEMSSVTVIDATSITISTYPGTLCFVARASSTYSGIFDPAPGNPNPTTRCHSYVHATAQSNADGMARVDGAGGNTGAGGQWKFTYYTDDDSFMSLKIYSATTSVIGANGMGVGFSTVAVGTPVRTLLGDVPRPGEAASGLTSNIETWDMKNDYGVTVSSGLYYLVFVASHPALSPRIRHIGFISVPVVDTSAVDVVDSSKLTPQKQLENSVVNYPNPARGGAPTAFQFRIIKDSNVTIEVLNMEGKRVFRRASSYTAGARSYNWDLTNDSGNPVGTGVYLLRITANDGSQSITTTKKIMVIK